MPDQYLHTVCTRCGLLRHAGPCDIPTDGAPIEERILNVLGHENATNTVIHRLVKIEEHITKTDKLLDLHRIALKRLQTIETELRLVQEDRNFYKVKCEELEHLVERLRADND